MCCSESKGDGRKIMRIILACALAGILAVPAKADETVKWRHVHHLTGFQTQQVRDADGHTLNLFRLPGIAFFPDGSIGTSLVIGTSDVTSDVGAAINGYYMRYARRPS